MSWDCYCTICGGPFEICQFRTIRKAKPADSQHQATDATGDGRERAEEPSSAGEYDSDESDESEYGFGNDVYDEDIITADEARWTRTLSVLGLNPHAAGAKKAFVSGPGRYYDRSIVDVEVGDDPSYPYTEAYRFRCYSPDDDDDPVFPFHRPCYELLAQALTRTDGVETAVKQVGKDALYAAMQSIPHPIRRCLSLDYGFNAKAQEQWWRCMLGYEFVVAPLDCTPASSALLRATIASHSFQPAAVARDLAPKVRNDLFQKLPFEIFHMVLSLVGDNDAVLSLCRASWPVNAALRDNEPFWRSRIRTSLRCLFELHPLIADDHLPPGKSLKGLLLALDALTRPRKHMRGPFMGLANRRHVWSVCEQLVDVYLAASR
ncbi:hypothetical protein B0H67DRAFT_648554 [Lasiosphaeris hirsuta]|uniref:F-box domain-containing protein n=1 Tax=Lasiosphaeris hirsuta TaxID=260670 RepID=A0AA40DQN3_9PEZI|nr:hypothetical protein B0H67DRAFT_648554 [Lasiosphaeris hirsuta]